MDDALPKFAPMTPADDLTSTTDHEAAAGFVEICQPAAGLV
jgi:hypothetical protein